MGQPCPLHSEQKAARERAVLTYPASRGLGREQIREAPSVEQTPRPAHDGLMRRVPPSGVRAEGHRPTPGHTRGTRGPGCFRLPRYLPDKYP